MRADGVVGAHRLVEDLLAVRNEQHALGLRIFGIECAEPRLAKPGREHNETCSVAGLPRGVERSKCVVLHLVRRWYSYRQLDIDASDQRYGRKSPASVALHPLRRERQRAWIDK